MTDWSARSESLLLDALLGPLADAMREVGLPLHILLESRFGDLNENQVEMIEAARLGADAADRLLRRAARIRALEGRPRTPRDESTRPIDLCRGALAIASAQAATRNIRFEVDLSPALPRAVGDRAHLEEALTLLLVDAAGRAVPGAAIAVTSDAAPPAPGHPSAAHLRLRIRHGASEPSPSLARVLALRLVEAEGGAVSFGAGADVVTLPLVRA